MRSAVTLLFQDYSQSRLQYPRSSGLAVPKLYFVAPLAQDHCKDPGQDTIAGGSSLNTSAHTL